jgi:hypothetical protein
VDLEEMFDGIRNRIEDKRSSDNLLWRLLVCSKDTVHAALFQRRHGPWKAIREALRDPELRYYKYQYGRKILSTKPIVCGPDSELDVHALTCKRDVLKTLWSIKTFYHYSGVKFNLFIHSDGSLRKHHVEIFSRHFKNVRIISKEEADRDVGAFLEEYEYSLKYRRIGEFYCSLKLFDPLMYSTNENILYVDSDILFFRTPVDVISYVNQGTPFFNSDMNDEYSYDVELLNSLFNIGIQRRFNAGLIYFNKAEYVKRLEVIEAYFRKVDKLPPPDIMNRHEQTLHALLGTLLKAKRLGSEYQTPDKEVTADTVSCHFFAGYHPNRYYKVGLKLLEARKFLERFNEK